MSNLNLCILRSGSHANCTAIWTEEECILIDCARFEHDPKTDSHEVTEELLSIGIQPSTIKALLITHAHGDHIDEKALKFAMSHRIPLYSHPATFERIMQKFNLIEYRNSLIKDISSGPTMIGHFKIESFETNHWADRRNIAGQSIGFTITHVEKKQKHKIGFVTDTKVLTPKMRSFLKDSHTLIIEANYSETYIKTIKPHPGYEEHLGNEATGKAIVKIFAESKDENALKSVFLAHISDSNNTVKLALKEVGKILHDKNIDIKPLPTFRHEKTPIYQL